MADIKTSGKRIHAAYGNGVADRIPVASPISWNAFRDIDGERPGGWRADKEFVELAHLVQEQCDPPVPYNHVSYPAVFAPLSYQRFLEAPGRFVERLEDKRVGPNRTRVTHVLHAAGGDLTWAYDEDDGVETKWDMIKPVHCVADAERLLAVPFELDAPPPQAFEPFRRHRREMGGLCIGGSFVNSMVAMLVGIMDYELVLTWVLEEPRIIHALGDAWLERTWAKVEYLLDQGVGPFWHFNGVERASPPMMGKRQWQELVVPYDGEIMRRIKRRDPEARIHVHCHGRVATLLDSWIQMGVDSIDPVEPPPQGDVTMAEARRSVGDKMTLYGNIEFSWMETLEPDDIERAVIQAIRDGGKQRHMLYLSATPHERHSARFNANARRYLECALTHGRC